MKYLVFDLEMTGDEPGWHEIIQIGACIYDEDWKLLGTYVQNVFPENEESFSMPSYEIHGLSLQELDDAPMMHEVLPEFENWIVTTVLGHKKWQEWQKAGVLKGVMLCGQSVINDINFLRFAYREQRIDWPFSHRNLDLYQLTYFLFELLKANAQAVPKSRSLASVAEYFGFERSSDIHNALEDAKLTGLCLKEVLAYTQKFVLQA